MADGQEVPELTYDEAVAQGYIVPQATPTMAPSIIKATGEPPVDLSSYGAVPGALGDIYNYGVSGLDKVQDYLTTNAEPRDESLGEAIRSGFLDIPGNMLETARNVPMLLGKGLGTLHANTLYSSKYKNADGTPAAPGPDESPLLNTLLEMVPADSRAEVIGSALGTALGMIPQVKPLKGVAGKMLPKIEKAILPYLGSLFGGEAANQGEQLVGLDVDTPIKEDMLGLVREGIGGIGPIAPGGVLRRMGSGVARSTEEVATKIAKRTDSFLDKDSNRVQAFFDNPEAAITRQGQPMRDALAEPEIRPILENLPREMGSKFNLFTEIKDRLWGNKDKGYEGEIPVAGKKIDNLISSLPPEASITAREILEHPKWKELELQEIGGSGGATQTVVRNVLMAEKKAFARMALNEAESFEYDNLLNRRNRELTGAGNRLPTKAEVKRFEQLEEKIKDHKLTPEQLRGMKTQNDKFAAYDVKSDPDVVNKADIYKDLGNIFRDRLHNTFKNNKPELYDEFVAANKKFGILMDLEPAVLKREAAVNLKGAYTPVGAFQANEGRGGIIDSTKRGMYPEIDTPEARLYRASEADFEPMGRIVPTVANIGAKVAAFGAKAGSRYAKAADKLFMSPAGAGYAGAVAESRRVENPRMPLGVGDISSIPEYAIPEGLKNDPEFMDLYKNNSERTELNRLQKLSDFLISKGPEYSSMFERSPHVGYTTVKDSEGYWRIMDQNQRDQFASELKLKEPSSGVRSRILKELNATGRIIQGGRVELPKDNKIEVKSVKTLDGSRQETDY